MKTAVVCVGDEGVAMLRALLLRGPPLSSTPPVACSGLCASSLVQLEQLQPQLWPGPHFPAPGAAAASAVRGRLSTEPAPQPVLLCAGLPR